MQHWCGERVCEVLQKIGIDAEIQKVHVNWSGILVLDDVKVYDNQRVLALKASRLAAKVDLLPLFNKKYHFGSIQINNAHFVLYQDSANAPLNIQHIIQAFSSKDTTTSTPLDLQIRTLTIRHSSFRYDRLDAPTTNSRFNAQHLYFQDISLTASLQELTGHSLEFDLRRFSFHENSGFMLNNLKMNIEADSTDFSLNNLCLETPRSTFNIPCISLTYEYLPNAENFKQWLGGLKGKIKVDATLAPSDVSAFLPKLQTFTDGIKLNTTCLLSEGNLQVDPLIIEDENKTVKLLASSQFDILQPISHGELAIKSLTTSEQLLNFLNRNLKTNIPSLFENIGSTQTMGMFTYSPTQQKLSVNTSTKVGTIDVQALSHDWKNWQATFSGKNLQPDHLLAKRSLPTNIDLHATTSLSLSKEESPKKTSIQLVIDKLLYNKKILNTIKVNGFIHDQHIEASIESPNEGANLWADATVDKRGEETHFVLNGTLTDFCPHDLGLIKTMEGESLSSKLSADLSLIDIEHIRGFIQLDSLFLHHDSLGTYSVGNLIVESSYEGREKDVSINNVFLNSKIKGGFMWKELVPSVKSILHTYLPSFINAPQHSPQKNDIALSVHVQDTVLIERTLGLSIRLPERSTIRGQLDTETKLLDVSATLPEIYYGNEHFSDLSLRAQTTQDILHGAIHGKRRMRRSTMDMSAELFAADNKSSARIAWKGDKPNVPHGSLSAHGLTYLDDTGKQAFRAEFEPSTVYVGDTLWYIQPGSVDYHEGRIAIKDVGVNSEGRYLRVNGLASREVGDTLLAELKDINVSYILGLINFHSVEFDGEASGHVWANSVLSQPKADAHLTVKDFSFNEAPLGLLTCLANYSPTSKAISLNAQIADPDNKHYTRIDGAINIGSENSGLDLRVNTRRFNLAFLHTYTKSFMSQTEGRTSGYARIFGPFKNIDLEGDLELENAILHVNVLNCTYKIPKDSVHLRPGIIYINQARIQDEQSTDATSHYAFIDLAIRHKYLSHLTYDLGLDLHRFLAYNRPTLGTESFCGTAVLEGGVHLWGGDNALYVDFSGTPLNGSSLTYNATQPDKLTEANFIRFKKHEKDSVVSTMPQQQVEQTTGTDIFLNFDLNITPDVALRVLMDSRSGDHIDIRGAGHLRASYFNKGNFKLYGTYQVENGQYDLSIQDFLHKEFSLQQGGTITFGGNPNLATLDLKAAYTVPNVSIDDLSATSLGLPSTRVDCIMHISGQPRQPSVAFDFELPTANEEERQMVRSLLSTEEERNLQVIYLLGIGRFLNMDGAPNTAGQNSQSQKAVNGIVSSTISNQFNRVLTSLIGNSNWNLGTNLRTGQMGWDNVDVEGVLSGKLFNNRLLINGNFGYRERFYNSSNFIGDFDVKYLITPSGSIGLKAFNKSNDRYFIQSSLNTQGVGIQFKKDFTNVFEIFGAKKSKSKNKSKEHINNSDNPHKL